MSKAPRCKVCSWEKKTGRTVDTSVSAETWAEQVDVHRTSITRHLGHAPYIAPAELGDERSPGYSYDADSDTGKISVTKRADRIIPLSEWLSDLRRDGHDPADYNTSHGHSVWGQNSKEAGLITLYANRFTAIRKTKKTVAEEGTLEVAQSVTDAIRAFTYIPQPVAYADESFVIVPADLQIGKVDFHGGSKETVEQALESFHSAAKFVKEFRPREICMVDAGDSIENIYSVSSQLGTNDLDLPHQVEVASQVFLEGIKLFAPLTPSVKFAAVSSNHGAHRVGPKSPAGDVHADYGIVIAKMLGHALKLNEESFGHVEVQVPEPHMESLYFQTSGTDIGVVHSHQAGGADKIGTWWQGQTHGNMPVAQARILLAGHWHSFRIYQSGDGRWVMVAPSSDRGSSWFSNARGERAKSGMLTFTTANNEWDNLRVL